MRNQTTTKDSKAYAMQVARETDSKRATPYSGHNHDPYRSQADWDEDMRPRIEDPRVNGLGEAEKPVEMLPFMMAITGGDDEPEPVYTESDTE